MCLMRWPLAHRNTDGTGQLTTGRERELFKIFTVLVIINRSYGLSFHRIINFFKRYFICQVLNQDWMCWKIAFYHLQMNGEFFFWVLMILMEKFSIIELGVWKIKVKKLTILLQKLFVKSCVFLFFFFFLQIWGDFGQFYSKDHFLGQLFLTIRKWISVVLKVQEFNLDLKVRLSKKKRKLDITHKPSLKMAQIWSVEVKLNVKLCLRANFKNENVNFSWKQTLRSFVVSKSRNAQDI